MATRQLARVTSALRVALVDLFTLLSFRRGCAGSGQPPKYSKPSERPGRSLVACRECDSEVLSRQITAMPRH